MDSRKRTILIVAGIVSACVLISVIIICYYVFSLPKPVENNQDGNENTQITESDIPQIEDKTISFIEGLPIDAETEEPVAVIIENYIDSRRQMIGLSEASLVFEAEAEGGITRFLALFPYQNLEKVGPVRSARPYFVKWAEMFDSGIVHAGGSTTALSSIYSSGRIFDLDCLALEGGLKYCIRDYLYYAPHNLFANLKDLREFLADYKWSKPLEKSFLMFGPLSAQILQDEENNAGIIHLYYPFPEYFVRWDYDKETNKYLRYQAGEAHTDHGNGLQITASNVVVMFTDYYPVDDAGRLSMKVEGEGEMYLFRDGKAVPGVWQKPDSLSDLKFYDENGTELLFTPGKTWISVLNLPGNLQFE